MSYKRQIENTERLECVHVPPWDIPTAHGTDIDFHEWQDNSGGVCVGYNFIKSYESKGMDTSEVGVHFFLDDYQFERVWRRPSEYAEKLKKYKFVLSPDFSLFTDHPKAVQLFSHYKKQWLQAYWESLGITVVPTICWSDSDSFSWCFDGVRVGTVVAVSTKGTQKSANTREKFLAGYSRMMKVIQPKQVLLFGKNPGGLDGDIVEMGYEMQCAFRTRVSKNKEDN